jgi:hypothetical protein
MRFSLLGPKKEGPCAAAGRTPVGYSAGVTGRAKVEQYQRFSNFFRSKNVP